MKIKVNDTEIEVSDIQSDSRKIKKGDLFIAYDGYATDGHDYIPDAIENGAVMIVGEKNPDEIEIPDGVEYYQVKDGREFWAEAEAQKYGNPQNDLKIVGVTGSDGKTTTVNFIYHVLKNADKKVGMISTVSAKYGDKDVPTGLHITSADPDFLYRVLREMVDNGVEYVVLEITSHGLIHKRAHGIQFTASAITNVFAEHTDIHGSYEQVVKDKALIMGMSDTTFLNKAGKGFELLQKEIPQKANAISIEGNEAEGLVSDDFVEKFPGDYNIQNASLAYKICEELGFPKEQIIEGLNSTKSPEGRFEKIPNELGISIIVDFAHTENSMRNILGAVKKIKDPAKKVITIFGCASERDDAKRSEMGKTSSELADIVIVTSEDPRNEDPNKIIDEIVAGNSEFPFIRETDRKSAIEKGIKMAQKGDWVMILGKGHEKSMNIRGVETPWSDKKTVEEILGH